MIIEIDIAFKRSKMDFKGFYIFTLTILSLNSLKCLKIQNTALQNYIIN